MIRVTAAIIIDSDKVFIAKRKPPGKMPGKWEFPGGKIEEGETPEQCLRRELREELGVEVAVGECVGTNVHRYDFYQIDLLAYKARILGGKIRLTDHSDMAWVKAEDLSGYEFVPADIPFVKMIRKMGINGL